MPSKDDMKRDPKADIQISLNFNIRPSKLQKLACFDRKRRRVEKKEQIREWFDLRLEQ